MAVVVDRFVRNAGRYYWYSGTADAWEMAHFGTLDRDGTGDFDGDGISDLDEYLAGTDPTVSDGVHFWTMGTVEADSAWKTVPLTNTYLAPVVIAGVPTYREAEPGTVRVRNVQHGSFEVEFGEWDYLDGGHVDETVPYVVVPAGREVRLWAVAGR